MNIPAKKEPFTESSSADARETFCVFSATSSRPEIIISENIWNRFAQHLYLIGLDNPGWTSITCRFDTGNNQPSTEEKPYCLQVLLANIREFFYGHEQIEKITVTENQLATLFAHNYVDPNIKEIFWSFIAKTFGEIETRHASRSEARWTAERKRITKMVSKGLSRNSVLQKESADSSRSAAGFYKGRPVTFRKGGPIFDSVPDAEELCAQRKRKSKKWEASRKVRKQKSISQRGGRRSPGGDSRLPKAKKRHKRIKIEKNPSAVDHSRMEKRSHLSDCLSDRPLPRAITKSSTRRAVTFSSADKPNRSSERRSLRGTDREPPACWEEVVSADGPCFDKKESPGLSEGAKPTEASVVSEPASQKTCHGSVFGTDRSAEPIPMKKTVGATKKRHLCLLKSHRCQIRPTKNKQGKIRYPGVREKKSHRGIRKQVSIRIRRNNRPVVKRAGSVVKNELVCWRWAVLIIYCWLRQLKIWNWSVREQIVSYSV